MAPPSLEGRQVGPYQIENRLGEGGMGVVYKAHDPRLGRTVALKFLPPHLSANAAANERFRQEARAASALDHATICTVYDIGRTDDGQTYIAMAHYAGETLKAKVARGPLPLGEALDYATQMGRGLARAHEAGIVHRDVKPANVIVTDRGVVKILDFGLAKVADLQLTRTGTTMGTVAYMSPEQAQGERVDHRTDLWSLGVVLYEMLTGERPFRGEYEQAVIYAILNDEPAPITEINPSLPPDLAYVVGRCLEKDAALRYPTLADLLVDLEAVSQGSGVSTARRAARRGRGMQRRATRHRKAIAGVSVLVALVLLAALAPVRQAVMTVLGLGTLPAQLHVAVLPFDNVGDDPANEAFIDGLVFTITDRLAAMEPFQNRLSVVPARDVIAAGVTDPSAVARALNANLVVTGSVARRAGRLVLTLGLVDAQTGRKRGGEELDVPQDDVAAMQEGVVQKLSGLLALELSPESQQRLAAGGTTAPDAYAFYMQGRGYLLRYNQIDQIDLAIGLFEKALAEDPSYALAYAGLGQAYLNKYRITSDPQWAEAARLNCERALEEQGSLTRVYVTRGSVHLQSGEYGSAKAFFELTLTRDSTQADALRGLAETYVALEQFEQAEEAYEQAIALKPWYWGGYHALGNFYFRTTRYEDAVEQYRQVVLLTPDNASGYRNLGGVLFYLRRYDEAIGAWQSAIVLAPTYRDYANLATYYYFIARDYTAAARMYEKALALRDTDYRVWGYLATAYYWAEGERHKAPEALRNQIERAEALLAVNPREPEVLARLALAYARRGEREQALAVLQRAVAEDPQKATPRSLISLTYEFLKDRGAALDWIGKALDAGLSPQSIEDNPWFRDLAADPDYQRLVPEAGSAVP